MSLHQPQRDFNLRRTTARTRTSRSSGVRAPGRRIKNHASINDLSTETLQQICGYFCLHCGGDLLGWYPPRRSTHFDDQCLSYSEGRRTLLSMCLISRRVNYVAQEVLFHEFLTGPWFPDVRWLPFAKTILERPNLAQAVRVVMLHPQSHSRLFEEEPYPSMVGNMAKKTAESRNFDFCSAWRTRLKEDQEWPPEFQTLLESFLDDKRPRRRPPKRIHPEVMRQWMHGEIMTLAIACLPRLEYWGLSDQAASIFHPPAMRALGINQLPVKTLELWHWGPAILHCAASIETLKLHCVTSFFQVPVLPNLKALHILDGPLSSLQLKHILSGCTKNLQTFIYMPVRPRQTYPLARSPTRWTNYESRDHMGLTDEDSDEGEQREEFLFRDLIEYLNPHRETLTTLHLDLSIRFRGPMVEQRFPSLKEFVALKTLFINSSAIYRKSQQDIQDSILHESLPPAIESLYLLDECIKTFSCLDNGLCGLASLKLQDATQFPNLKNIVVDIQSQSFPYSCYEKLVNAGFNVKTGYFVTPLEMLYSNGSLQDFLDDHFVVQENRDPKSFFGIPLPDPDDDFFDLQPLPEPDDPDL